MGSDLSGLVAALRASWGAMWNWPLFAWLQPRTFVRLTLPDGTSAAYNGPANPLPPSKSKRILDKCKLFAVQLPEDILLRRNAVLPELSDSECAAALRLEAQSQSPFAPEQLVWVPTKRQAHRPGTQAFELILTSRDLVQAHLEKMSPHNGDAKSQRAPTEVWMPDSKGLHQVLPGFGEGRRLRQLRNGFRLNVAVLLVTLCILVGFAVTPTLQLRLRAMDAVAQHSALQRDVAHLLQQREALVKIQDHLQSIDEVLGQPTSVVQILDIVTRALPSDTSVLTFQIQATDSKAKQPLIQMTGQTSNAAVLMQHLGQQPGVRDVKSPNPATKPPGAIKESFSIEFTLDTNVPKGVQ